MKKQVYISIILNYNSLINQKVLLAQSVGSVKYSDYISAEG